MQTPGKPIYPMPVQQPMAPPPNVIVASSPVVSPAQVFPERYGLPPLGVMPGYLYPPYPPGPLVYPPPPPPFGPYRFGYPYPYPYPFY